MKPLGCGTNPLTAHQIGSLLDRIKPGDVIGFSASDCLGWSINLATFGIPGRGLSHIAMAINFHGDVILAESTILCKSRCVLQGKRVKGVQAHWLYDRLIGYKGRVWVYPLQHPFTQQESERATSFIMEALGKNYDAIGAYRSTGAGFGWLESLLRVEDLSSIFCSELVAADFRAAGRFPTKDASHWSPNRLARQFLRDGIIGKPWEIPQ